LRVGVSCRLPVWGQPGFPLCANAISIGSPELRNQIFHFIYALAMNAERLKLL